MSLKGIVSLASSTCQWRDAPMDRTQRNQWRADFESGVGHLENPLFLADVTMPIFVIRLANGLPRVPQAGGHVTMPVSFLATKGETSYLDLSPSLEVASLPMTVP